MPEETKPEDIKEIQARLKKLEEENESLKNDPRLRIMDVLNIKSAEDFKRFTAPIKTPEPEAKPKETKTEDEDLKERVRRLEAERKEADQSRRINGYRENVRSKILEKKESLPFLARVADDVNVQDAIIQKALRFIEQTGHSPNIEKIIEETEEENKSFFEKQAETYGYKKAETKEEVAEPEEKPEEEPEEKKPEFKKLSPEEYAKLSQEERYNYHVEESDFLERQKRVAEPEKKEAKVDKPKEEKPKKETKEEVAEPEKEEKPADSKTLSSSSAKEVKKPKEDMTEDEERVAKMREAGFDI